MKYSVIIPVYNAEKTLSVCVDSLLSQNYSDMEIILINDGSTDGSGTICEDYFSKYEQIKYIKQNNAGVSSARNSGLKHATGTYILFVDSDDAVSSDYFKQIDVLLLEYDYDFIQFSYTINNGNKIKKRIQKNKTATTQKETAQILSQSIYNKFINSPWNKVFKREIISQNRMHFTEELSMGEDKLFNIQYITHIDSCRLSSAILYLVNASSRDSLSRKKRNDLAEQFTLLEKSLYHTIDTSDMPDEYINMYRSALNFVQIRSVYADAKRLHRDNVRFISRMQILSATCDQINKNQYTVPSSLFCFAINMTVKLKMVLIIDFVARKLLG